MKNKILNLVLALAITVAGLTWTGDVVLAKEKAVSWDVTYTDNKLVSTYEVAKSTITDMMPGDTIKFSVAYKNAENKSVDFYLSTDVLNSLEDKAADGSVSDGASGGAYSYKISNLVNGETKVIFDSKILGGESSVKGLNQVKSNLPDGKSPYFELGVLPAGSKENPSSGTVEIVIELDGNSQDNSYMYKLATLDLKFGVEETKTSTNETNVVDNVVTKNVVYTLPGEQQVVVIDDPSIPLDGGILGTPATGDSLVPVIGCSIGLLVGLMLIGCYFIVVKKNREEVA